MGNLGSLSVGISGMWAAQSGLSVIGHNLANVNTEGYSRQQTVQSDWGYLNLGVGQLGLGTNVTQIRQLRNEFLDVRYRQEVTKANYYSAKAAAGTEIENLLGEMQSEYQTQTVIQDMWDALNELVIDPSSLDARGNFVQTSITFIDKMNIVSDGLTEYQQNLNDDIIDKVDEVNRLVADVNKYNVLIKSNEVTNDKANDYRDSRNLALDKLSELLDVTIVKKLDGTVDLQVEGNDLLSNGMQNTLGLRYTGENSNLVEPVFTTSEKTLAYGTDATPLFKLTGTVNAAKNEDGGLLKGLIIARGLKDVNYATLQDLKPPDPADFPIEADYRKAYFQYERDVFNATQCTIPVNKANLDTLFNKIVTMINDAVAPQDYNSATAPVGEDDAQTQFMEIFVRKYVDRYDGGTFNQEDPTDKYSMYTLGNVEINKELLNPSGYNKIALSYTGDESDLNVPAELVELWKEATIVLPNIPGKPTNRELNIDDTYNYIVTLNANDTAEANNFTQGQVVLVNQLDNERLRVSGVNMDEELSRMMVYQNAYDAAARIVSVIDSMLDQLINRTAV